jgi:erythromycin esterase
VLTGQGNDRILLNKLLLWPWQTHEVLDLIDWMRAYNADPSHPDKVHFAGFDPQGIDTNTYDEVMGYLQTVDPQRLTTVASLYSGLRPTPGGSYDTYLNAYLAQPPDIKERYLHQAQQVYDLLAQQQTGYEATISPQAYAHALYAARVIVQFAQLMSIDSTQTEVYGQQRDAFLGEDAAWLHDHAQGGHKVVLWAHNGHVQTQAYTGITRMGMYLRQRYHSDYVAVGMSFYQGSFNAVGVMSNGAFTGLHEFTLPAPDHGSYNDVFGHTGLSLYALDLRHLPHDAVGNWLAGPHPFLLIGATYDSDATRTSSYWPYESVSLPQTFDVIIHIQKVTASSLLLV